MDPYNKKKALMAGSSRPLRPMIRNYPGSFRFSIFLLLSPSQKYGKMPCRIIARKSVNFK